MRERDEAFFLHADLKTQRRLYAKVAAMTPDERFAKGIEMSNAARNAHLQWISTEYPSFNEGEVRREYLRAILTEQEFSVFYPHDEYRPAGYKPYESHEPWRYITLLYEQELENRSETPVG
ncbi:MAG: hypothetical protein HYV26_06820 [Candidatus Hydrogenedentes bacterium]|nr:hypothetical protein [Candidatus Hydrogenedentota bacterium]